MTKLKFFASVREVVGKNEITLDVKKKTSLKDIIEILDKDFPIKKLLDENKLIIALNHEVAGLDAIVKNDDEVAIFPPVSGG